MANQYDIQIRDANNTVDWDTLNTHPTTVALSAAIDASKPQYWTETHNIGAPNATVPVNQWLGIGAETNIDVAITPKGTGALLVQIPTNSTAGGAKRGTYALDFQRTRSATGDVASGTYSIIMGGKDNEATGAYSILVGGFSNHATNDYAFIGGGTANTASGEGSVICGGYFNRAQGQESICAGGYTGNALGLRSTVSGGSGGQATGVISTVGGGAGCQAIGDYSTVGGGAENFATGNHSVASGSSSNARIEGCSSHASGNFTGGIRGDCQHTKYVLRISGSSTRTLTTNQSTAGAANQIVLEDDQMMIFQGTVTAKLSGSEIAAWQIEGLITRDTGVASTLLITHTITEISNTPGWSIALSADTTNGALKVETTVDGSLACSSMAVIESTEMIYTL